jgi:kynurenine 3-monooxygenase
MRTSAPLQIVGAGPAGSLLALLLAQRGCRVRLFEKRPDPRGQATNGGRSINLALAARGLKALAAAGLGATVRPLMMPMPGRIVHDPEGRVELQAYGQAEHEVIHSVSRAQLTNTLVAAAAAHPAIEIRFEQDLIGVSPATNTLFFRDLKSGTAYECALAATIATDGAGSAARLSLAAGGWLQSQEDLLDHAYKELTIPAQQGRYALDPAGLHIWPRQDFMLIALPNPDGSFTATLFLPAKGGTASFAALAAAPMTARQFFVREFPDVLALMPDFDAEFTRHPLGILGTVRASRWHVGGQLLLLGDAAHAIVPFHGQGMNCAFEDCLALRELFDQHLDWATVFAAFEAERRPQAEAIARMALENYQEMRDDVLDPEFLAERELARTLERLYPGRIIPRYSMVMFHPEIPYATAFRRGAMLQECVRALRRAAGGARPDAAADPAALAAHPAVRELLKRLPAP